MYRKVTLLGVKTTGNDRQIAEGINIFSGPTFIVVLILWVKMFNRTIVPMELIHSDSIYIKFIISKYCFTLEYEFFPQGIIKAPKPISWSGVIIKFADIRNVRVISTIEIFYHKELQ